MAKHKQLISSDEAKESSCQHKSPCSDCPWSRKSLKGWLGSLNTEEWLQIAHNDVVVNCHVISNQQCAGLAIYRKNICKSPRPGSGVLLLDSDKLNVFANPMEFMDHHGVT